MTNENGYIIVRLHKRNENRNEKHLKNNKKHEKCSKKKGEKMFREAREQNKKLVFGLIHLLPMPGTPYYEEGNL